MRNAPQSADLLQVALDTFQKEVLPQVPASARYAALMVANAMGIAARQARAGSAPEEQAREVLAALIREPEQDLPTLERRVCQEIREGRYDPPLDGSRPGARTQALYDTLIALTRAKAAESCPKALGIDRSADAERMEGACGTPAEQAP